MRISFSLLFIALSLSLVQGQILPVKIEKSTQVIRYQGVDYYIHSVKAGQTLYSICHVYGVTEEEIVQANPGITISPLSIGQVLKIPQINAVEEGKKEQPGDPEFILHTVKPKETPFFLHQKYNVPLEIIYQYNPGTEAGLQIGQTIRIPRNYKESVAPTLYQPQEKQELYKTYRVKQGDTLYRISKDFDVKLSDLIRANPDLRWGLKTDQLLRIPGISMSADELALLRPDSILSVNNFEKLSSYQCDSIRTLKRMPPPVKAVLLLPFFARETLAPEATALDSLSDNGAVPRKKRLKGRVAAEFYEGFLLAIDSLRQQGVNISLFVYDTEGDTNRVKQILKDLEIVEPDVILGPLSPDNIKLVSRFSFERKIPFVPPLATDDYLFSNNPFAFRVIPPMSLEQKAFAAYLAEESVGKNVILIYKKGLKNQAEVDSFKQVYLNSVIANPLADTLRFTEVFINDSLPVKLDSALHNTKENLVIVYSSYEPDVINTLSRLHFLMREHPIKVYGMPAWQKFENVRVDVMHELQVTLHTPFYIDYRTREVQNFVMKCRKQLNYEPFMTTSKGTGINYTFLGYDLGMYYLQNLYKYGKDICPCSEFVQTHYLLSDYRFKRNMQSAILENSSIVFIQYGKDYVLRPLGEEAWIKGSPY